MCLRHGHLPYYYYHALLEQAYVYEKKTQATAGIFTSVQGTTPKESGNPRAVPGMCLQIDETVNGLNLGVFARRNYQGARKRPTFTGICFKIDKNVI